MLVVSSARADELRLKNGDRLTGVIVSSDGGKIQFIPDFAKGAPITIAQADVATFATTAPTVLKLKDGTVTHQSIRSAADGQVTLAADGPMATQTLALDQIEKINPAAPVPVSWHGALGVNGLYSDSSSTSLLAGFSASATRATANDTLTASVSANFGQQTVGGVTTTNAENWAVGGKYSYYVFPKVYSYVDLEAAGDHVNFLNLRFTPSAGFGYRWVDAPDFHVTTDAGFSFIYEDYATKPKATENAAVSLSYHIDRSWDAGRIAVFHSLQVLPALTGSDVLAIADAGVRTALTKSMYSEIKANLNYDSNPAPGSKSTTSQIKIGLGWTY